MKAKCVLLGVVMVGLAGSPALAIYSTIQHNMIDGTPDTSFDPSSGLMTINQVTLGGLTLTDGLLGFPQGVATNVTTFIETTFDQVLSATEVQFTTGTYSLTFDFNDDAFGNGDGIPGPVAREISGDINLIRFTIGTLASFGKLDGIGNWHATTINLPGSGNWPDGGLFSGLDTLTIDFGGNDLANYDWEGEVELGGDVETTYSIFPDGNSIPEPASLSLLLLGMVGLLRRR